MNTRKIATLAVVALVAAVMFQPAMAGVGGCRSGVGGCRGWDEINAAPAVSGGPSSPSSAPSYGTPSVYGALAAVVPAQVVVVLQTIVERPDALRLYIDGTNQGVGGCRGGVGGCVQ